MALERSAPKVSEAASVGDPSPGGLVLPRVTTTTTAPPTTTTAPPTTVTAAPQPPPTGGPAPTSPPPPTTAPPTTMPRPAGTALCIGDSVMLGASPQYHNTLSMCRTVDAEVSRQFRDGDTVASGYKARNQLGSQVVVHLGSNGYATDEEFNQLMAVLKGVKRVVIVNVQLHGSRQWESSVNDVLARGIARCGNCVLADWKRVSDPHPEWFGGDGIHLSAAGAQGYAQLLASKL